ncbi:MAG: hypothetical protein KGJ13_10915 [Patescibacteria group bacterium]|nr:hypothetical protein [Patescibacteria group bacterium]
MRKSTLKKLHNEREARGEAALALLKSFLENSTLISRTDPKTGKPDQRLAVVMTSELAFAICESFGWPHEIVSSNTALTGKAEEKEEKRIITA